MLHWSHHQVTSHRGVVQDASRLPNKRSSQHNSFHSFLNWSEQYKLSAPDLLIQLFLARQRQIHDDVSLAVQVYEPSHHERYNRRTHSPLWSGLLVNRETPRLFGLIREIVQTTEWWNSTVSDQRSSCHDIGQRMIQHCNSPNPSSMATSPNSFS